MTLLGWLQFALFAALVLAAIKPLGGCIARIAETQARIPRPLAWLEGQIYRLAGIDPTRQQTWSEYALALMAFWTSPAWWPFTACNASSPSSRSTRKSTRRRSARPGREHRRQLRPLNTSWQSYAGRNDAFGYMVQMAGITVQSFLSAASQGHRRCRSR